MPNWIRLRHRKDTRGGGGGAWCGEAAPNAEPPRAEEEPRRQALVQGLLSAFDHAPIGMALIDLEGRGVQVNGAFCRLTGYTRTQLQTTPVQAITHPDDRDRDAHERRRLVRGEIASYEVEKRYLHAWGHYVWVLATVSLERDEHGRPLYFIKHLQDISARKAHEQHLEALVDHDSLTGLFNRRRFEQELSTETGRAARYGAAGALLLIDLDQFKDINDRFGHQTGDDLLKAVAAVLSRRVRQTDIVARLGGDEFAVILTHTNQRTAQLVAGSIVKALRQHASTLGPHVIRVTASVGIAIFDGRSSAQEVMARADLAMYQAKGAGRDAYATYPTLDGRTGRFGVLEHVRQALDGDHLRLYCQPMVDLATGAAVQYELLLRLQTERGSALVAPHGFLWVAERFGLVRQIDDWVVRRAIELLAESGRMERSPTFSVNVSAQSIGDPRFASLVRQGLAAAGVDPTRLVFELPESAAISHMEAARLFAKRMRDAGCQIALDDFGTGFGSFSHLRHLPFDLLKIDGAFVKDFASGSVDHLLVRAIVTIARGMGKKTAAEGIGGADVVRRLRECDVDYGQGFYLGRPRPIETILSEGAAGQRPSRRSRRAASDTAATPAGTASSGPAAESLVSG